MAFNNMGVARSRRGEHEEAERCFRNALAAAPGWDAAEANLTKVTQKREQPR